VKGLHIVDGVTPFENISICMCLIDMLCMSVMLECYNVFRCVCELLLIPLILYGSSNSVIIVIKCFNSLKSIFYISVYSEVVVLPRLVGGWRHYKLVSELSEVSE
jgi:ABC-type arginine transport system permease subunit